MLAVMDKLSDVAGKVPTALVDYGEFMKQPTTSGEPLNTLHVDLHSEPMADAEQFVQSSQATLKDNKTASHWTHRRSQAQVQGFLEG